jgi:hypothetical protein
MLTNMADRVVARDFTDEAGIDLEYYRHIVALRKRGLSAAGQAQERLSSRNRMQRGVPDFGHGQPETAEHPNSPQ